MPPSAPAVPPPDPEKRRIAAENFDRARQVLATGNHDYGVQLLKTCCQLDPANFLYRQQLRRAQKEMYGNDLRGSRFAFLTTPGLKRKVKQAKAARNYLDVLTAGEEVFTKNPWDLGTTMDMAEAFDALGLIDLAVFTLDQARQKYPKDATLNRALARVFEKRGDFQKAIHLWNLVKETNPTDVEAAHKAKDLAASETIKKGGYEDVAAGKAPPPATVGGSKTHAALGAKPGSGAITGESALDRMARDEAPLLKRLEADPTEPSLYVQLATLYRRHGAEDRARAVLQQGAGPTGNHFSLQLELLELDLGPVRKNLELTEAKIKKLRAKPDDETDPDGPSEDDLRALRAKLAKEVLSREAEILRVKADRFTGDLSHRLELGQRLLKLGQADEAIAELQQARRDERLKGRAALLLALGFRSKNNWRLAQRNLEDALAALPATDEASRKEALYQLATGCAENNDRARAVDVGHELANIDFGYKNIGKLLDEWEAAKA